MMTRIGLLVALGIAVVVGVVFAIWPQLDLAIMRVMSQTFGGFGAGPVTNALRLICELVIALVAAPAFAAVAYKLLFPARPMLIPGRTALLMIATLAIGPGLLVNSVFKDHSGRPRPIAVAPFSSQPQPFVAWWDGRGPCRDNCSFMAGESSGAFWTTAAAIYAPPQWRPLAYGAALAFGSGVGLLRMAGGGHFFTDVVMGGVLVFVVIWLAYALLYRWRDTRTTDAKVEQFIAGLGMFGAPQRNRPASRKRAGRKIRKARGR